MGCYDVYCFLCEHPCHSDTIKWMNRCSMLLQNNSVVHGLKEISCNVEFCKKGFCATHLTPWSKKEEPDESYGLFLHTDCWKFVKKKYGIALTMNDLPPIDYFNKWMTKSQFSELEGEKSISSKKLMARCALLKITAKMGERKGPRVSAGFYKEGDIKIGQNKMFWIVRAKKWVQMKGTVRVEKVKMGKRELLKLPFVGEFARHPLFIRSIEKGKDKDRGKDKGAGAKNYLVECIICKE